MVHDYCVTQQNMLLDDVRKISQFRTLLYNAPRDDVEIFASQMMKWLFLLAMT